MTQQSLDHNDRGSLSGPPKWVKVSGIILVLLIFLIALMALTGSNHGPWRHFQSKEQGGQP
jgi:hypothetical protein